MSTSLDLPMDTPEESLIDSIEKLEKAHDDFIAAAAEVLKARQSSDTAETPNTDDALKNLKQHWELLVAACERADQMVQSLRVKICSECLVDEATGGSSLPRAAQAAASIPPMSALRLENIVKTVRDICVDLKQGGEGSSNPDPAFDYRRGLFIDDLEQEGGEGEASNSNPATSTAASPGATAGFDVRFKEDAVQEENFSKAYYSEYLGGWRKLR